MKIIIANKSSINEHMKMTKEPYGVIALSEPYDDPVLYSTQSNMFSGMLKLYVYDCDDRILHDKRLLFNVSMCIAVIKFYESMSSLGVQTIICHCKQGLHRSVAVAEGLQEVFKEHHIEITNRSQGTSANEFILNFFRNYKT